MATILSGDNYNRMMLERVQRVVAASAAKSVGAIGLMEFTRRTFHHYVADPVHELIATTLDKVISGEIDRLMIFAPPQHGKSELFSRHLPAYWLGLHPDEPVISTSYGAALAYRNSRDARTIVESLQFSRLFPDIITDRTSRAVDHWSLQGHRGMMIAAGVGGPIVGAGGMMGIIDDPFQGWSQAWSKTIRDNAWDWYRGNFRPRIWEGGAIVIGMTRWHQDDLAGRLLKQEPGRWTVLRLPALSEGDGDPLGRPVGEPLAPSRFGKETLEEIRIDIGSLIWSAEYQGTPHPAEGSTFKAEQIEIVEALPVGLGRQVRCWDLAATEKATADYTAGVLMARGADNLWYVLDVRRGQWSPGAVENAIKQAADLDGREVSIKIEQEPGASGKTLIASFIQILAGWHAFGTPSSGDKVLRALPLAAQVEAGNVRLVRGEWNAAFIDELASFPNGDHDDQVDAAAGAFNELSPISKIEPKIMEEISQASKSRFVKDQLTGSRWGRDERKGWRR